MDEELHPTESNGCNFLSMLVKQPQWNISVPGTTPTHKVGGNGTSK